MPRRNIFIILFQILFVATNLCAQVDTNLVLKEIYLIGEAERNQNYGGKKQTVYKEENLNQQQQDLGQILIRSAGIYIKSYGANSLATSSIRGGSAGHTLLLWNGIPLVNPSLGLVDFSLIPAGHSDQISLHKGGNSALWGSGAIGGVINMQNNKVIEKNRASANVMFGSFGQATYNGKLEYKRGQVSGSTNISFRMANNDFEFKAAANRPVERLTNAAFTSTNITQNLRFKIGNKQDLTVHYWWQESYKEIPATITQTQNLSNQEDTANRILLNWRRLTPNSKLQAKFALLDEHQFYQDPSIDLTSTNQFVSLVSELSYTKWINNNHQIIGGSTYTSTDASTNGYPVGLKENKLGLWASYRIQYEKLHFQASMRAENVDGNWIPLTPNLGADYLISERIIIGAKLSRNYRIATLNDRFWSPGGNENLLPENGWSQELNLITKPKLFDESQINIGIYNRRINNWILWSPAENQNFWKAQNLAEVWSRGFEIESKQVVKYKNMNFGLESFYNFVKSTNEVAITLPKIAKGEQLVYTPKHQLTNTLFFERNSILLALNHIYRSENKGINEDLAAYNLLNLNFEYKNLSLFKCKLDFNFGINNLFGKQYYVVERRPMPLRNFTIGIKLKIK